MSDSGRTIGETPPTARQLEAERLRFASHAELLSEVRRLRAALEAVVAPGSGASMHAEAWEKVRAALGGEWPP